VHYKIFFEYYLDTKQVIGGPLHTAANL